MKILVINGPNLNMLGIREPDIYGRETYKDLVAKIENYAKDKGVEVKVLQTNYEGEMVTFIQGALGEFDSIIINPAAYTHSSVAILDAAKAVGLPLVEVHISDVSKREDFRQISYIRQAAIATISGEGTDGYLKAMDLLIEEQSK